MGYRVIPILLSTLDLREPYHGGARATLGYLALASLFNNNKALYVRVKPLEKEDKEATYTLTLQHYDKISHVYCIEVPLLKDYTVKSSILNPYVKHVLKAIVNFLTQSECVLSIISWRHFCPIASLLRLSMFLPGNKRQKIRLVGIADALPGFYSRDYISTRIYARENLKKVIIPAIFGRAYYAIVWRDFDIIIAISNDIRAKLKSLLYPNVIALYPLYVKIQSISSRKLNTERLELTNTIIEKVHDLSQRYELTIFSSAPLNLISVIAKRNNGYLFLTYSRSINTQVSIRGNIILIPKGISDNILSELYKSVDLVWVHREIMTGISITILEALYYQKPIVCNITALRGYEDLIHTDIIFPYYRLRDISELLKLMDKHFTYNNWRLIKKIISEDIIERFKIVLEDVLCV